MHIGIDYGSKLAGTSVICFLENNRLVLHQSEKKQDADLFLEKWIQKLKPENVFIDAPLSLPLAFYGKGQDFFYREADRQTQAMSPMFLGGLTARAIQLKTKLESTDCTFFETYPAQLLRLLFPSEKFTKDTKGLQHLTFTLVPELPFPLLENLQNRHQVDAALAWISGWRYISGLSQSFGKPSEGIIWV